MGVLGYNTVGGAQTGFNSLIACQFTASEDGTGTSMSIYSGSVGPTLTAYMGIYSDDGSDYPADVLGETNSFNITSSTTWYSSDFKSSVSLTNGTKYWLAVCLSSGTFSAKELYDTGTTNQTYRTSSEYTIAATFPAGAGGEDTKISIYLTYTAATTNTSINIGDTWKEIEWHNSAINIGDTWKAIDGVAVNISDTWKTVYGTP